MKQQNKIFALKRFNSIYKIEDDRGKRFLIEDYKNKLNILNKHRLTDIIYRCNCGYCLDNILYSFNKKVIALNDELKEYYNNELDDIDKLL